MTEIHTATLLIRLGVGFTMVCFGISQFTKPELWTKYVPTWFARLLPVQPPTFLRIHSMGNFFLGLLFMLGVWPVLIAWLVAAWWSAIFPFAFAHDRYVGLRDLSIIFAVVAVIVLYGAH